MNKKEICEIRKQLTPSNCAITRICGCYVDAEKEKKTEYKDTFLALPEEEMFKYFDIFRKALSGKLGKNLVNLEFNSCKAEGQQRLLDLRKTKLDDESLEKFYDLVIENYQYDQNYLILLAHAVYDIPGKASDDMDLFDASDEVYEHIICCICPVKLSNPALSYDAKENTFSDRIRDWIVDKPMNGFLFPAFNDRSTDIHSCLVYSKKADILCNGLIDGILKCTVPYTAKQQKEYFDILLQNLFEQECTFEKIRDIYNDIAEESERRQDSGDNQEADLTDIKGILKKHLSPEKQNDLDTLFCETFGKNGKIILTNLFDNRNFKIRTPDVCITISPELNELVDVREINGHRCIVIESGTNIEVNGCLTTGR